MIPFRSPATAAPPPPQPVLTAPDLVLRPLAGADAPLLAQAAGDARVARATRSIPHPLPPGAAEGFIAAALDPARTEDVWAIDARPRGGAALVGVVSLKALDRGQSQVGYWIAPQVWNAGLASAALRLLVAANPHGARTLFAEVFQDNPASARVLTHAGFDYIGDAEAASLARGGATVPTWTYLRRMA